MTDTRKKLSEAKYFLNRTTDAEAKSQPRAVGYNLSAFLCAFRSILDVIQKESKSDQSKQKRSDFDEWWETQEVRICQDAKVVLLCNVRDENIHERPTQLVHTVEVTLPEDTPPLWGELLKLPPPRYFVCFDITQDVKDRIEEWKYCKKQPKNALIEDVDALRESPAITICQDGLSTLERIVLECEQRFPM
jgi:hypothetical protein